MTQHTIIEVHLKDGKVRTYTTIDRCDIHDGVFSGFHTDGRLLLRQLLSAIGHIEVKMGQGKSE